MEFQQHLAASALFGSTYHALCNVAHVNEVVCAEVEGNGEQTLDIKADHSANAGSALDVVGADAAARMHDAGLEIIIRSVHYILACGSL